MDLHSISVRAKRVPLGLSAVPPMTKWKYSLLQISLHSLSPHFALYSELELEHRSRSDCVHEQVAKRIANVRFTLGPAKHEKVAIYVVNQRISNVCRIAGAASQRSNS